MVLAFIVATYLSVRASRIALTDTLKGNLEADAKLQSELTRSYLIWTRGMAIDLAAAAEANKFKEEAILRTISKSLENNDQVFGSTIAYEPRQFDPSLYYWAPYYSRTADNELRFTQLGNPGYNYFQQDWYTLPKARSAPVLSPPYYDEGGGEIWMVTWSVPFYGDDGNFIGVSKADIALSQTEEFVKQIAVGEQGYAFLIDQNGVILGIGNNGGQHETMVDTILNGEKTNEAEKWNDMIRAMLRGESGFADVVDLPGNPMFVAFEPIGLDTGWSMGLAFPQTELFLPAAQLQNFLIIIAFMIVTASGFLLFLFTQSITMPLQRLALRASQFTQEQVRQNKAQFLEPIQIKTRDELQDLANAFNQMNVEFVHIFETLEERVVERTENLNVACKQSERRAKQFETAAQVAKTIASIRDLDTLLPRITQLISQQFGFYHTGIFLLDDAREYAVLSAANSEGGKRMLAREHKLKVGQTGGIVGYVTGTGNARVAINTGADAIHFNNPDLPGAHSEMAIPLRISGQVMGALDVQSTEPNAFGQEDIEVLSALADQVAVAIQNARSFSEMKKMLAEAQRAASNEITQAWKVLQPAPVGTGYQKSGSSFKPLEEPLDGEHIRHAVEKGETVVQPSNLVVPIRLRGQVIGVINLRMPRSHKWSEDEVDIAEALSERLSLAIETATLLNATQRRAGIEKITSEISGKISSSTQFETILQTAAQELSRALGGSEVLVQIEPVALGMKPEN